MRYDDAGNEIDSFVLNRPAYRQCEDPDRRRELRLRLVTRARALGAARLRHPLHHRPSFADIFFQQLLQERHLADRAAGKQIEVLMAMAEREPTPAFTVDLERQEIRLPDGCIIPFEVDPFRKACLLGDSTISA